MLLFGLEGIEPEGLVLVLSASTADLPGGTATNIDNGFGSGYAAVGINRGPKGESGGAWYSSITFPQNRHRLLLGGRRQASLWWIPALHPW